MEMAAEAAEVMAHEKEAMNVQQPADIKAAAFEASISPVPQVVEKVPGDVAKPLVL